MLFFRYQHPITWPKGNDFVKKMVTSLLFGTRQIVLNLHTPENSFLSPFLHVAGLPAHNGGRKPLRYLKTLFQKITLPDTYEKA